MQVPVRRVQRDVLRQLPPSWLATDLSSCRIAALLAQGCDVLVEVGAAAVSSRQLVVEAAEVADVWLGGDEEDGHAN